jgi:hypothetical protein
MLRMRMNKIYTPILLSITKGFNPVNICVSGLKGWVLFVAVLSASADGIAQASKVSIMSLAPEWQGQKVCEGYNPSFITAPSVSYSGTNINEPKYTYHWEQQIGEGKWVALVSAKDVAFIRSFDPPVLELPKGNLSPTKISWRLSLQDLANGAQTQVSDAYSLMVYPAIQGTYSLSQPEQGSQKTAVVLDIKGGFPDKTFAWEVVEKQGFLAADQVSKKDQSSLSPGTYKVTVSDNYCTNWTQIITISKPN